MKPFLRSCGTQRPHAVTITQGGLLCKDYNDQIFFATDSLTLANQENMHFSTICAQ
jgi:hypothetical protein